MTTMKKWCLSVLAPAVLSFGCLDGPAVGPTETAPEEVLEGTVSQGLATFTGTVLDPSGQPIAGATVVINGINRTTDTAGKYFVSVNSTTGYIISVSKSGFAPMTDYLSAGLLNNTHVLPRAPIRQFSATQAITIEAGDLSVVIPAGSLFNAAGQPVTGTVLVSAATYNPRGMPGDFTAVNQGGRQVALESVGAFFIGATTLDGQPVNLGKDRTAEVTLRVPQAAGGRMPPCVLNGTCRAAGWRFDATINRWVEQRANFRPNSAGSTFTLIGGPASTPSSVVPSNGGLGTWNIDLEFTNPACTIVEFVGFPAYCYDIKLNLAMQNAGNTFVPFTDTVTPAIPFVVLYNNRPNVDQEVGVEFPLGAPADCAANMTIFSNPNPTDPSTYPIYTPTGGFTQFNSGAPWGGTGFPKSTVTPFGDITLTDIVNNTQPCNSTVTFVYNP
ncbi:carboxypeptidase regulatory-like domain-containing protein [Myxococcus sp. CA051A]|nr:MULTISPECIES: carboxypeptidase-like regulatory domain-containing protein [Myxococcus]NTX08782.1 carboxypeptidase regulatory-like domain-containing protein [Myxococcus sp. CA040A]NTX11913.1 carboxypeptidase regulatory-like domain-containing protein [Myxococcus sp. CA056]NTX39189.1 carboxypeptidase regulatory-like domain-containing protein [Myxococcus sp. CA033]NTX65828.1 carboxypeptidase regulatory-like domain-containing protein [Myxococcus sp. CA051A]